MLVSNETINEATLQFWIPSAAGAEHQHYTFMLTRARIAGIRCELPNTRLPETMRLKESEEITLVYETIEWTWNDGGIRARDDWKAPLV